MYVIISSYTYIFNCISEHLVCNEDSAFFTVILLYSPTVKEYTRAYGKLCSALSFTASALFVQLLLTSSLVVDFRRLLRFWWWLLLSLLLLVLFLK